MSEAFEELFAEIGADLSGLESGLKTASSKVHDFAAKAGDAAKPAQSMFDKLGGSLSKVGAGLSRVGSDLTRYVTLPLVGVATAAVKSFSDFDAAMTQSTAIMGKLSDTMRDKLEKTARDVAKTTSFSAKESAESYFFLASAGLDAAASIEALPKVASFAQAGMFDMARATDLLTDAQSALGLSIRDDAVANMENMVRVSDVLVKANTLANASVEQFSEALTNRAGASARQLGKDVEETVAVLAAFADQGTKGEKAGEALSIVWRDLQKAALENEKAFRKFNVSVFDSAGEVRNTADIIADLEKSLGGMSDAQKKATLSTLGFQERSISNLLTLIGTSDAIRRYEGELRNAAGVTQEVADKQLKSFKEQMGLAKDRVIDAAISLGERLAPTVLRVATVVSDAISGLGRMNTAVLDMGIAAAAVAASSGGIASLIGKLLQLGPKGLAVVALVGGAAAMAAAYSTNFGRMKDTLDDFVRHLGESLGLAKTRMTNFSTFAAGMASGLATEFDVVATALNELVSLISTLVRVTLADSIQQVSYVLAAGYADLDRISEDYQKREEKRMQERYILQTYGFQGLMDHLARIAETGAKGVDLAWNKEMGKFKPFEIATHNLLKDQDEFIKATAGTTTKAGESAKSAFFLTNAPVIIRNELIHCLDDVDKGALYREAQEIGFKIGSGVVTGNREGLEKHSPTRVERDVTEMTENVLKTLAKFAPEAGKRAKKAADAIKESFDVLLASINRALQEQDKGITLTESLWAKLSPDIRKHFIDMAKAADEWRNTVEIAMAVTIAKPKEAMAILQGLLEKTKKSFQETAIVIRDDFAKIVGELPVVSSEKYLLLIKVQEEERQAVIAHNAAIGKETQRARDWEIQQNELFRQQYKKHYDHLVEITGSGMAAVIEQLTRAFGKSIEQANKFVSGVVQVIGNLPGAIGDKLLGATNEFTKWVNQVDGILRGLHKIFNQIPDGLSPALESLSKIFKKNTAEISSAVLKTTQDYEDFFKTGAEATGKLSGTVNEKVGGEIPKAFGIASAAVSGFVTGLTTASATGSKAVGALVGGIQGALQGFLVGGPVGAIVGGIGGLLGGLFGGKSAHQKEMERLAEERARADLRAANAGVTKALEEAKQSMLQTASQTAKLFDELLFSTKVPKKTIRQFIDQMAFLFVQLADGLRRLTPEALAKIKEASEALQPASDLLASLPLVFEGISRHISVGEQYIKAFFDDFGKVVDFLGALAEETPNKLEKHIKKFSLRLQPAAELLAATIGFLKDMFDVKPPSPESFDIIEGALEQITVRVGNLAESMDKKFVKVLSWFSEKAKTGVEFWREGLGVVKEMVDIPRPSEADFKSLFSSLETGLNEAVTLAAKLTGEAFDKSVIFWERAKLLYEAVRGGMDITQSIASIEQITKEKWKVWVSNIETMVSALAEAVDLAETGVDLSFTFFDATQTIYDNISAGVNKLADAVRSANAALASLSGIGANITAPNISGATGNVSFSDFDFPGGGFGRGGDAGITAATHIDRSTNYIINDLHISAEEAERLTVAEAFRLANNEARAGYSGI